MEASDRLTGLHNSLTPARRQVRVSYTTATSKTRQRAPCPTLITPAYWQTRALAEEHRTELPLPGTEPRRTKLPYRLQSPSNILLCFTSVHTVQLDVKSYILRIAVYRKPIAELRSVTCHMVSHSVIYAGCHPTQVNAPCLNPRQTRFAYAGGMKGWVDLDGRLHREMVYLSADSHRS